MDVMSLGDYLVAIDGGATKTDMVLCTMDGRVIERVIGGPTNPNDIGFESSIEYLREMLLRLLKNYGGLATPLSSFYAGLSGGSVGNNRERYSLAFKDMLPNVDNITNGSDAINALNSGIGCEDGMVLIAGTGSVVFVRSGDKIIQIGGWGYLLDDAGSGYDLGCKGFRSVLRAMDGRGPDTILTHLYNERMGGPVHKFIPQIYDEGKSFIASFSPLIFEAEAKGDMVAGEILDTCGKELALLVLAGSGYLEGPNYPVVLVGGLWKAGDELMERFKSHLGEDFLLIEPDLPPVYGATVEALKAKGKLDERFYLNFKDTLPEGEVI
jgi:N-acetylglucosamine kinase-like BadF-type ATPase